MQNYTKCALLSQNMVKSKCNYCKIEYNREIRRDEYVSHRNL